MRYIKYLSKRITLSVWEFQKPQLRAGWLPSQVRARFCLLWVVKILTLNLLVGLTFFAVLLSGTLLPRLPSEPGMTLLTIRIEKIGLKDAGQCIDPYITVSVKGK